MRTRGTAARQRELSSEGLHDLVMCRTIGGGSVIFLAGPAGCRRDK
jgi:hypothetical protein